MHETSEYKALQKKANVRLAKAAKDLSDSRERERIARRTIQQVTEQLLVSERYADWLLRRAPTPCHA